MRLFRYRSRNELLFKELRYNELYMATPDELNDPLDLNGRIQFPAKTDKEFEILSNFIFQQSFGIDLNINTFTDLKRVMGPDILGAFLKDRFKRSPNAYVQQAELYEILCDFYEEKIRKEKSLRHLRFDSLEVELNELFKKFFRNSTATCFSETNNDFLMWSHYASGHAGVCIEYELTDSSESSNIAKLPLVMHDHEKHKSYDFHIDISKVQYRENLPLIDFFDFLPVLFNQHDVDLENLSKSHWHPYADDLTKFFLCKLSPWALESEWRAVEVNFRPTEPEDRIYEVHQKSIVGIYFGAKSGKSFQRRVMNIYNSRRYPIQFYQCSVDGSRGVEVTEVFDDDA